MEDKKRNIILLVLLVVVVIAFISLIMIGNKDKKHSIKITDDISMVTDNSRFFTVSSCVSSYLSYLSNKDTDNLLLLLDDQYKEENYINSSTLYSYIEPLDGEYTFSANRMYQEKINDDVMKYYVKGYIEPDIMQENTETITKTPYYVIVYLDLRQSLFSIAPYDGKIFNEGDIS